MKAFGVKLMRVGLLVAVLFTFCPRVMPLVNQVFAPPVVHQPKRFCRRRELSICQGGRPGPGNDQPGQAG